MLESKFQSLASRSLMGVATQSLRSSTTYFSLVFPFAKNRLLCSHCFVCWISNCLWTNHLILFAQQIMSLYFFVHCYDSDIFWFSDIEIYTVGNRCCPGLTRLNPLMTSSSMSKQLTIFISHSYYIYVSEWPVPMLLDGRCCRVTPWSFYHLRQF